MRDQRYYWRNSELNKLIWQKKWERLQFDGTERTAGKHKGNCDEEGRVDGKKDEEFVGAESTGL